MPSTTIPRTGPERHGCAAVMIRLSKDGSNNYDIYTARRVKQSIWKLTKRSGDREGASYLVGRTGELAWCTCPDATIREAACKHLRAVLALRLLPRPRPGKAVADA